MMMIGWGWRWWHWGCACDTAERSGAWLDAWYDGQYYKHRAGTQQHTFTVTAGLHCTGRSLHCFPHHLICVHLSCLQATASCLRGNQSVCLVLKHWNWRSCFPKKVSLQLSSEQSIGDVWIAQLDRKRVPQARFSGCRSARLIIDWSLWMYLTKPVPNMTYNVFGGTLNLT